MKQKTKNKIKKILNSGEFIKVFDLIICLIGFFCYTQVTANVTVPTELYLKSIVGLLYFISCMKIFDMLRRK